jgi:phage shock protein A
MGIFSRLNDVIRSYLNAAVARAGNPQKILRLIIQDMEDTLVKVRASSVQTIAERKDLERRMLQLRDTIEEWTEKAEVAVVRGRDDLANAALQAKVSNIRMLDGLEKQYNVLVSSLARQSEDMEKLQLRLQDAKVRERTIGSLHTTARTRLKLRKKLFDHRLNDALARFEHLDSTLNQIEGKVESYDIGIGHSRGLSETLGQLAIESSVNSELAELKVRLGNQIALAHSKA